MRVEEMQRKLSEKAERVKDHRFDNLYSLICQQEWIERAYRHIQSNRGNATAGVDGVRRRDFENDLQRNLRIIQKELKAATFTPLPVRRTYLLKKDGKKRRIGVTALRDKVVQEALRMVLEPIFEADFSSRSYGFRPTRSTLDAIAYIGARLTARSGTYYWILEGDLSSFFDTLQHRTLLQLLKRRIKDRKLLSLIRHFLKAGVMEEGRFQRSLIGTAQGGVLSPLLSNIYLHELDKYMERQMPPPHSWARKKRRQQGLSNYHYVRYADDFIVMCDGGKAQAEALKQDLTVFLRDKLRVTLSQEKTKITHINDGFQFLGYWIERSTGAKGRLVPKFKIPQSAMKQVESKIKATTAPNTHQDSVQLKFLAVNRIIGGWCRYYQYTSSASSMFHRLRNKVYWRIAHWLARKHKAHLSTMIRKYSHDSTFRISHAQVRMPSEYKTKRYPLKRHTNPYLTSEALNRETLPTESVWNGYERRGGMADLRLEVLQRDSWSCRGCGTRLRLAEAEIDHIIPRRRFTRREKAEEIDNLQSLCGKCHQIKTQEDRKGESRVQ